MVLVHRVFRRELGAAPELVRRVRSGDRERAAVIAEHVALLLVDLHHHHTGEDELLWPRLRRRTDVEPALIRRMETQHDLISALMDEANAVLPAWRKDPDAAAAERLADTLDRLASELDIHLREEEAEILPLATEHLTVAEWEELGERGLDGVARSRLLWALSAILDGAGEAERAKFMSKVPLPARIAWRLVGRRSYRRRRRLIYGSA
jgi:iron-sulfur cluster repair protein YtfE (RIC family)